MLQKRHLWGFLSKISRTTWPPELTSCKQETTAFVAVK